MDIAPALITILAVLAIGVISPGPSFIFVARTAVAVSRAAGVAAAVGMAVGATVMAIAALLGLAALLRGIPSAWLALKLVGGGYLLFLAWKTWRGAGVSLDSGSAAAVPEGGLPRHFGLAVATMLGNPKAAVVYGVTFAALLPRSPARGLLLALPPSIFLLEGGWYLLVALALSAPGTRQVYLRAKRVIDRTAGAVLGVLGLRLLLATP